MKLEGIHHVTCITGNAPQNVEFYADTLGLRLVKKSVNQDDPTVYHLFYADEEGGAGMVHLITWRVASQDALEFWQRRLGGRGVDTRRTDDGLRFDDPEGLGL